MPRADQRSTRRHNDAGQSGPRGDSIARVLKVTRNTEVTRTELDVPFNRLIRDAIQVHHQLQPERFESVCLLAHALEIGLQRQHGLSVRSQGVWLDDGDRMALRVEMEWMVGGNRVAQLESCHHHQLLSCMKWAKMTIRRRVIRKVTRPERVTRFVLSSLPTHHDVRKLLGEPIRREQSASRRDAVRFSRSGADTRAGQCAGLEREGHLHLLGDLIGWHEGEDRKDRDDLSAIRPCLNGFVTRRTDHNRYHLTNGRVLLR